jgi:hypothetical protein
MKSRFISNIKFLEILKRLVPRGTNRQIDSLFQKLCQQIDFGGSERSVVDLKALLFLLEIADGDSRRTFEDKTCVVSTDVEFWNQHESCAQTLPFSPIRPTPVAKNRIISSKGFLYEENYSPHSQLSVASLIGGSKAAPGLR